MNIEDHDADALMSDPEEYDDLFEEQQAMTGPSQAKNGGPTDGQPDNRSGDPEGQDDNTQQMSQELLCLICDEDCRKRGYARLRCGHYWCKRCLDLRFVQAAEDKSEYPPKCCHKIEMKGVGPLFTPGFRAMYKAREDLYSTPPQDIVFCAKPSCATLLQIDDEDADLGVKYCYACKTLTCLKCRKAVGMNQSTHDCRIDTNLPDLAYSADNRCKYCPTCRTAVSLADACNEVTCRACGSKFCFVCLLPWKDADASHRCPRFKDPEYDEDLYAVELGIHRDTGFDREGYNLFGLNARGLNRNGGTDPIYPGSPDSESDKHGEDGDGDDVGDRDNDENEDDEDDEAAEMRDDTDMGLQRALMASMMSGNR